MNRRIRRLLSVAALGVAVLGSHAVAAPERSAPTDPAPASRPNVLLIVLDDVGFSDLGAYGGEIRTPNIDALAARGLRYNRFDTKAICSATRAALLTGRNSHTVGMGDLAAPGGAYVAKPVDGTPVRQDSSAPRQFKLDPTASAASRGEIPTNAETIAQALHAAGYETLGFGKWHLAPFYDEQPGHDQSSWPLQRGFDHFYGFIRGWTDQYNPDLFQDNAHIKAPGTPGYLLAPDLIDHAIAAFGNRPGDKPKFVYLALGTAHAPIQVPKRYIDAYGDTYAKGWDAIRAERFARQKAMGIVPGDTVLPPIGRGDRPWSSLPDQEKRVFARFMAGYAGFITHADEQIGRLIAHLKKTGQYDNTLIVLLSDNGAAPEAGQTGGFRRPYGDTTTIAEMDRDLDKLGGPELQPLYQRPWAWAGATPFRRYKLWPLAGGSRDPLIVAWGNGIKAHGEIRQQMVDVIDLGPTILEAAGTFFRPAIDGVTQIPVAGVSITPTFTSSDKGGRQVQYFELRGNRAITSGDWKAVAIHKYNTPFGQDKWQLFNLAGDFSETRDLASRYPAKLKELQALWWQEAIKYSDPPLAEPSQNLRNMNQFEDGYQGD